MKLHTAADNPNKIIGIGSSNSPISGAKTATNLEHRLVLANTKDDYLELNFQMINKFESPWTEEAPSLENHSKI